jgi:hypothetical protein
MEAAGADHMEIARLGRDLADATEVLDAAEEAWLELADDVERRGLEI